MHFDIHNQHRRMQAHILYCISHYTSFSSLREIKDKMLYDQYNAEVCVEIFCLNTKCYRFYDVL